MIGGKRTIWREALRTFFGPLVLYALIIQALVLPLARTKAATLSMGEAGISVLCTTDGMTADPSQPDGSKHVMHGLDCCLPGRWAAFDQPFIAPANAPAFMLDQIAIQFDYASLPPVRGPPTPALTPLQPRAPPIPA